MAGIEWDLMNLCLWMSAMSLGESVQRRWHWVWDAKAGGGFSCENRGNGLAKLKEGEEACVFVELDTIWDCRTAHKASRNLRRWNCGTQTPEPRDLVGLRKSVSSNLGVMARCGGRWNKCVLCMLRQIVLAEAAREHRVGQPAGKTWQVTLWDSRMAQLRQGRIHLISWNLIHSTEKKTHS